MEEKNKVINLSDLNKFVRPNGKKIRDIRENQFEITQSSIEDRFIRNGIYYTDKDNKKKSRVSLRTYIRIEKGEDDINKKYLNYVAILFTRLYKKIIKIQSSFSIFNMYLVTPLF